MAENLKKIGRGFLIVAEAILVYFPLSLILTALFGIIDEILEKTCITLTDFKPPSNSIFYSPPRCNTNNLMGGEFPNLLIPICMFIGGFLGSIAARARAKFGLSSNFFKNYALVIVSCYTLLASALLYLNKFYGADGREDGRFHVTTLLLLLSFFFAAWLSAYVFGKQKQPVPENNEDAKP